MVFSFCFISYMYTPKAAVGSVSTMYRRVKSLALEVGPTGDGPTGMIMEFLAGAMRGDVTR